NRRTSERVQHGTNAVRTHFVYDGSNVLLEFVQDDSSPGPHPAVLAQRYLDGPAVDQVFAQDNGAGGVAWLLADHLGTVRDLVDNGGAVVNHFRYDSFGNLLAQ